MRIVENLVRTLQAFIVGFFIAISADGITDFQKFALLFGCVVLILWLIIDVYREARGSW